MGQPARTPSLSPEDYLRIERDAPIRSEYLRGEMFAMAGGTYEHSLIKANLVTLLNNLIGDGPCVVADSDLKIHVVATGLFTYPDASVICEETAFEDDRRDVVQNPTLVAEVFSESSEAYDRGKKFEHYRQIRSLREYLLIAQDRPHIERYFRNPDDTWTLTEYSGLEQKLELVSLPGILPLSKVYNKITFPASSTGRTQLDGSIGKSDGD